MKVDKVHIINELMKYKNVTSKADFARFLEITPQGLATWLSRNTFDINKIENKFPEVSEVWLLTGKGEMLKGEISDTTQESPTDVIIERLLTINESQQETINRQSKIIETLSNKL